MTAKSSRVLTYSRVSTVLQSENGISLESQDERMLAWCSMKGHILHERYVDAGISGSTIVNRPSMVKLLSDIRPGDIILTAELSRLSRSTSDAMRIISRIEEKHASLVCLSPDLDFSTPTGKMIYTVLMAFHELERVQIKERIRNNMKTLSEHNLLRGRCPYGMKFIAKNLPCVEVPEQKAVIQRIIDMFTINYSPSQISLELNTLGLNKTLSLNKTAQKEQIFYPQTIKRILCTEGLMCCDIPNYSNRYLESRKGDK